MNIYYFKEICDGDFNRFQNLKICLVGDLKHGRTVHSLIQALSFFKCIKFSLVSPPSLKSPSSLMEALKKFVWLYSV
jgi:aspartate carbamoyltransferase catalytic subunit